MRFFFAALKGKPRVLNTHGSLLGYKKYLRRGFQQLPYKLYDCLTFKLAARSANIIVVSSSFEYDDAVEFGIEKNKLRIVPMGIDLPGEPHRYRKSSPLNILFAGRLARVRRVELLLMAASKLTIPYRLCIVGGEEETASLAKPGYLRELQRLSEDLGIQESVSFMGAKAPAELAAFYQDADVFVYPSLYENFGQPIMEAAAAGLPIVSTNVGVAREIVRDNETGFIISANPDVIGERITQLNDPAVRKLFGEKIRTWVENDYSWKPVIENYIDIYRSLTHS